MLYSTVSLILNLPFFSPSCFSIDISPQSSPGAHYETSHWGASLSADSFSSANTWDKVITNGSDPEAWPSINCSSDSSHPAAPECPLGSASSNLDTSTVTTTSSRTFLNMATGAAGQPAHYPSLKANSNMMTGPGTAIAGSRGWGSDGKQDGGRIGMPNNWGSPNFNLNLNPKANPSAWPVLGHEGGGGGGIGPNGVSNTSSHPPGINGNGNLGNGSLGGADNGSGGWVSMISANENDQPRSTTNASLSFSMESANLNTDGPNHTKQQQQQQAQEPMSPIPGLTGWGGQSPTESSQLNGDTTGSSVWGSRETKAADSPKESGWDSTPSGGHSAWGRQGSGGGGSSGSGGWGDWGKSSGGGEASKGWDSVDAGSSGSGQEQQLSSWGKQPGTAPASEGSGDSSEGQSHHRDRSSSMDFTPLLPRQDLDPRVLSNSGWGQTPIRQHTVWEMEEANSDDGNSNSSSDTIGGSSTNSGASSTNVGTINIVPSQRPGSGGKSDSEGSAPSSGWGTVPPQPIQTGPGWGEPTQSLSKATNGSTSGWGDPLPAKAPKSGGTTSWGSEDKSPSWDNGLTKSQPTGWGQGPKSSHGWGNGNGGSNGSSTGDWGEPEVKNSVSTSSMWEGEGENGGGGWKESPRNRGGGWGKPTPTVSNNGWGDTSRAGGPVQGGWGSSKPQESSSSSSTGSGGGGSIGSWGGPGSVKQNTSSWGNVNKQDQGMEPTGWEEPSPPSIRRKKEIDDGTSTWGDPGSKNKTVNMWDRNNPNGNPGNSGPPPSKNGGMIMPNNNNNNHPVGTGSNNHHHTHHMHNHSHHGQAPSHLQHQGNNNGSPSNGASHQAAGPQSRQTHVNLGKKVVLLLYGV